MTSEKDESTVCGIVLNWNNYDDTAACVNSLNLIDSKIDIIVIDNGSSDNSDSLIKENLDYDQFIRSDHNLGFAGGMNLGIEFALENEYDYIWLLNNDVEIPTDVVPSLIETLESDRQRGAVSPIIEVTDSSEQWFKHGTIETKTGRTAHVKSESEQQTYVIENGYIPFAAAMFDSEVFEKVGLLDEQYFLYFEDVDFCTSMRNRGYKVVTDTRSIVNHAASSSTSGWLGPTMSYYQARNRWLYVRKFHGLNKWFFAFTVYWVLSRGLYRLLRRKFNGLTALLYGTYDGFLNEDGEARFPN